MNNPYSAPKTPVADPDLGREQDVTYAGFWIRFLASFIDSILVTLVTAPILMAIYGRDYFLQVSDSLFGGTANVLISYVLPAVAIILFWIARQATPGKMALSIKIVDADTYGPLSSGQAIGRYLGYYVSIFGLLLGFIWVAFDARKQGWHDKLARTVVIRA
jgi:uncharacterized RDD family membrane protein YckC